MYILDLPTGISLINGSEDNIYGNEDYFFVSDHMPDSDEEFQIWSNIMWAKDPIQYSPLGDIEYKSNGKIEANKVVSVEFTNVKNSTPIIDNQENIVNNNKPTNSPIISDKEDINQNTTNKLGYNRKKIEN